MRGINLTSEVRTSSSATTESRERPQETRGTHRLQESALSASVSSTPSDSQTPTGIPEAVFFSFFPTEVYDLIQKCIQRNSTARHLQGLTLQALRGAINRPWKAVWSWHRRTHTRDLRRQRETPPELEVLPLCAGRAGLQQTALSLDPQGEQPMLTRFSQQTGRPRVLNSSGKRETKSFQKGALPGLRQSSLQRNTNH